MTHENSAARTGQIVSVAPTRPALRGEARTEVLCLNPAAADALWAHAGPLFAAGSAA